MSLSQKSAYTNMCKTQYKCMQQTIFRGYLSGCTDDLYSFCCVRIIAQRTLFLDCTTLFYFSITFLVLCSLTNLLHRRDWCSILIALCFNTLQSVSDSAIANAVMKAKQLTMLENLISKYFDDFLFIITQPHSKCEPITPIRVDKKGFFFLIQLHFTLALH